MENIIHEECGVFGIFTNNISNEPAKASYFALYALQHRGQESCGIAVNDRGIIKSYKDIGLLSEVFNEEKLKELGEGNMALGHVRYSTSGNSNCANAQPLCIQHIKGPLAIAHNGNITNALKLRRNFESCGAIFHGTSDSEVIAYAITANRIKTSSIEEAVKKTIEVLEGAFSFVVMSAQKLIAARDRVGFKPLCIGETPNGSIMFASESCVFSIVGGKFIREIKPGEVVTVEEGKIKSDTTLCKNRSKICVFEYIYFARPDSVIENCSVYDARIKAGKLLAKECPAKNADIVIGVPDSGLIAAKGFAMESKIPHSEGFVKNKYIGRSFIEPTQEMRENAVKIKLNAITSTVKGKRIVMVDDSIVRGTTTRRIVKILRNAGAKEVHVRISSPPFKHPCFFGTDVPNCKNLIACKMNTNEIAKYIGADSLGYLSIDNVRKLTDNDEAEFCTGCFSGIYPVEKPNIEDKNKFEQKIKK